MTPALTLRSITAYRDLETDDFIDIDATQLEIGDVFVGVKLPAGMGLEEGRRLLAPAMRGGFQPVVVGLPENP